MQTPLWGSQSPNFEAVVEVEVWSGNLVNHKHGNTGCITGKKTRCVGCLSFSTAPTGRCSFWQIGKHQRLVCLLSIGCRNEFLYAYIKVGAGSGSIQLFVQRCFMGLEPEVSVKSDGDDGDSAWRWWKWMRKYRVWEANRKVFLYPENWIEPELRRDKSSFFQDLENELLQN